MMRFLLLVSTGLFFTKMRAAWACLNCWVKGYDTGQRDKQHRKLPTRWGSSGRDRCTARTLGVMSSTGGVWAQGLGTAKVEGHSGAAAGVGGGTAVVGRLSLPGGEWGPW